MAEFTIETWGLTKQFNGKTGCKNITLQVRPGTVFGFLGPNGAGKSTFVRTMLGLLHPTSGHAQILGRPLGDVELRGKIGYLPELFRYPEWLTGNDLLESHAELAKVPRNQRNQRIHTLLKQVGLIGREKEKIRFYSKGMQQRIGIACALVSDPELIVLDEPTSALDPIGRREVRQLILELRQAGKTVFLNSHLLSEVEPVCDEIAIIHKSELIVQGNWRKLADFQTQVQICVSNLPQQAVEGLHTIAVHAKKLDDMVESTPESRQRWLLQLKNEESIPTLVGWLGEAGIRLYELIPIQPNLEDVFLYWVNRKEQEYADNCKTCVERNHL